MRIHLANTRCNRIFPNPIYGVCAGVFAVFDSQNFVSKCSLPLQKIVAPKLDTSAALLAADSGEADCWPTVSTANPLLTGVLDIAPHRAPHSSPNHSKEREREIDFRSG